VVVVRSRKKLAIVFVVPAQSALRPFVCVLCGALACIRTRLLWRLKHRRHRGNASYATQQMLWASDVDPPPKSQILRTFLV